MLSSAAEALPAGDGWLFEPKWDGFRTLVFRDGDEILLQSRDEKPMNRYFPELLTPLASTISSPSRKTSVRNPSHFGSKSQPSSDGNPSAAADSIGASGGSKGRCKRAAHSGWMTV